MNVEDKIKGFLKDEPEVDVEFDDEVINQMLEFMMDIEPDQLSEDQADELLEILDFWTEPDEEKEELTELMRKKKRIDPTERRKRRKLYRRTKAKVKRKLKKYRRSARGKLMKRKSKRMGKRGRTATGKRQRTFIGGGR
jgi:hypothetical protein